MQDWPKREDIPPCAFCGLTPIHSEGDLRSPRYANSYEYRVHCAFEHCPVKPDSGIRDNIEDVLACWETKQNTFKAQLLNLIEEFKSK